jgi:hypothetical protein
VGGTSSVVQGGKLGSGFLSSTFAKVAGGYIPDNTHPIAGAFMTGIVGGTASRIGGGKFANGAMTSAFQYLFNEAVNTLKQRLASVTIKTRIEAMNILRTSYSIDDFTQFSQKPNYVNQVNLQNLTSDIANLNLPRFSKFAQNAADSFGVPYIGPLGKVGTALMRYSRPLAIPDLKGSKMSPRRFIKVAGDYIYDQK